MKQILFRSDDLGYCEAVNYGIEKAVKEGIIQNVGVMINMESADHGLALLKDTGINLGLHVNVSAGKPVADPKRIQSLVDENGCFKSSKEYRNAKSDFVVLDEVMIEIEAQLALYEQKLGHRPDYFECHAVSSPMLFKAMEIVSEKYQLKYNPLPNDFSQPIIVGNTQVYMHSGSSLERTPFECLKEIVANAHEDACELVVYHAGYVDAFLMRNSSLNIPRIFETEMLVSPMTKQYLAEQEINIVTYSQL